MGFIAFFIPSLRRRSPRSPISQAPTSFLRPCSKQGVDGRDKPGQDARPRSANVMDALRAFAQPLLEAGVLGFEPLDSPRQCEGNRRVVRGERYDLDAELMLAAPAGAHAGRGFGLGDMQLE